MSDFKDFYQDDLFSPVSFCGAGSDGGSDGRVTISDGSDISGGRNTGVNGTTGSIRDGEGRDGSGVTTSVDGRAVMGGIIGGSRGGIGGAVLGGLAAGVATVEFD